MTHRPTGNRGVLSADTTVELSEFRRSAIELGLVDALELDRFSVPDDNVARLAGALVRAGKLTNYQAAAPRRASPKDSSSVRTLCSTSAAQGGMGVVFKALHRTSGIVVALKVLPPSFGRDRDAVLRFRREIEVAARLDHPNIVKALDANDDRGVHFLAMEFIEGQDLDALVSSGGPMPIDLAVYTTIEAARGMEAAHARGIVHRDIKPANLMLARSGVVQVLDLGLARVIESASPAGQSRSAALTQTGTYMGTVDFTAPEQADDARRADHRADIYSLGCTLYYLLAARPPFEGETLLKKLIAHGERPAPSLYACRNDVPAALEETYQAMMSKQPADRPQSMAMVIHMLEACRGSTGTEDEVRGGLTTYAARVFKRASPRRRDLERNPSVFARSGESEGVWLNPDLRLEDLITDYRPEVPSRELPEESLPPRPSKVHFSRSPSRRSRGLAAAALGILGLLVLGVGGYSIARFRPLRPHVPTRPTIAVSHEPGPPPVQTASAPKVEDGFLMITSASSTMEASSTGQTVAQTRYDSLPAIYRQDFAIPNNNWPRAFRNSTSRRSDFGGDFGDGYYYLQAPHPGMWSYDDFRKNLIDFSCEIVGRVVSDIAGGQGSWGIHLLARDSRGFQALVNSKGQFLLQPSFWGNGRHRDIPSVGPIVDRAIRPGNEFNTLRRHAAGGSWRSSLTMSGWRDRSSSTGI